MTGARTSGRAGAVVRSVNVGRREPNPAKRAGSTGFDKRSVEVATLRAPGPKKGGLGSGVVGDFIGDQKHHGGDGQAVYAFAREELDLWASRLERELPDGSFGENLTTVGIDVDAALVGERWQVGPVVLEVTGPRLPCATFAHRMGVRGWTRTFTEVGRTGAYLAVRAGGEVRPGDAVEVLERPDHDITVPVSFRALMGDPEAAGRVLAAGCLVEETEALQRIAQRRR